ncbi:MAG TPA: phytochelatin synthase family protein [Elusimicrobiales bacterium]|nr:phytochelatin synthase family protein [Elusimicrobiales bacterium]
MKSVCFAPFLFAVLLGSAGAAPAPKYSPAGGAAAVPLAQDNSYFRDAANPAYDFWALASYYAPQRNGYSCSAASVAMALNALLGARRQRGDAEENITEENLLAKAAGPWKALVSEAGSGGRHGLTLKQLADAAREALAAYGAAGASVSAVSVSTPSAAALESFRAALAGNERDPRDIMLLHFTQDTLTGAPGGPFPHISPVGAYDAKQRRVLIFDVDRQWYEPYWASDAQVLKAMAAATPAFGRGGYALLKAGK